MTTWIIIGLLGGILIGIIINGVDCLDCVSS
jgi:hypothetical protein